MAAEAQNSQQEQLRAVQEKAEKKWNGVAQSVAHVGLGKAGVLGFSGNYLETDGTFAMGVEVEPGIFRNARFPFELHSKFQECSTVGEVFANSATKFQEHPCMGWRDITEVHIEGERKFEKYTMSDYKWLSYGEAKQQVDQFGAGLAALKMTKGQTIAIYAETSKEWQLTAQACFARGYTVATVYESLGGEALQHGLEQTEVTHIVTDAALMPAIASVINQLPKVTQIIFTKDRRPVGQGGHKTNKQVIAMVKKAGVEVMAWDEVLKLGASQPPAAFDSPSPEDMAVIMYTSGSTDLPKGVVLTHANLVAGMVGVSDGCPGIGPDDVFLSFLPLAHILALIADSICLALGAAVGYGSARTITDKSAFVHSATCRGDAPTLRPTIMAAVPAIMDRIKDGVFHAVQEGGRLKAAVFNGAYASKKYWGSGSFWDWLVFDGLRAHLLGGRLRMMISGGGPLSEETQKFMNIVFCCPVGQGYGLTETCGAASIMWPTDPTFGRVGPPISCCEIKLMAWEDGGYLPTDKPNPRGEILLGGPHIAQGYFQMEDKTAEDFQVDEKGRRWFHTGDIGEFHADGVLQIIDRKKDLVKNQNGEYISYGKIEPLLKECPLVDNVMVYQDPAKSSCVALVTCKSKTEKATPEAIISAWQEIGKAKKLGKVEIPTKVHICEEPWTPDNDMTTAALKLKRNNIIKKYQKELDGLYR